MERIATGTIEMTWDPNARVAELRFERETHAKGDHARILVDALARWVATGEIQRKPFAIIGNGVNLAGVDAEYRAVWSAFLRHHREECYVAFFNMGPVIRIAAEMFRIGTGLRLKAFANEEDGRAWLRERGIST